MVIELAFLFVGEQLCLLQRVHGLDRQGCVVVMMSFGHGVIVCSTRRLILVVAGWLLCSLRGKKNDKNRKRKQHSPRSGQVPSILLQQTRKMDNLPVLVFR